MKKKRTIKSPPKPRPSSLKLKDIKEAVKKAPPKRVTAESQRARTYSQKKPEAKLIHRIIAFPFQTAGFLFLAVFVIFAIITKPWGAKKLLRTLREGLKHETH